MLSSFQFSVVGFISHLLYMCSGYMGFPRDTSYLPMQEMQETLVRPLGWEDPLEERVASSSSILAWKIPWTDEPGGL